MKETNFRKVAALRSEIIRNTYFKRPPSLAVLNWTHEKINFHALVAWDFNYYTNAGRKELCLSGKTALNYFWLIFDEFNFQQVSFGWGQGVISL